MALSDLFNNVLNIATSHRVDHSQNGVFYAALFNFLTVETFLFKYATFQCFNYKYKCNECKKKKVHYKPLCSTIFYPFTKESRILTTLYKKPL